MGKSNRSNEIYRTVFIGKLEQQTSLSIGGSLESVEHDFPLARDGLGRFTIRGTSLAGAIISLLRKCEITIDDHISGERYGRQQSRWIIHNSHPTNKNLAVENRQMVRLNHATRTAEEGALFEVETLPKGITWDLFLEVDVLFDEPGYLAMAKLAFALKQLQDQGGYLGANAARGMGLVLLKNLKAYHLTAEDIDWWPDSTIDDPISYFIQQCQIKNRSTLSLEEIADTVQTNPAKAWYYLNINSAIPVGKRMDGYGVDSLSIGGHKSMDIVNEVNQYYLLPDPLIPDKYNVENEIDHFFVSTRILSNNKQQEMIPFIPGSSIRGSFRHSAYRMLNHCSDLSLRKEFLRLFGTETDENTQSDSENMISGALIIHDAYLEKEFRMAVWENHAEDEFAQGVYGTGKFNRSVLMEGDFQVSMKIEAGKLNEIKNYLHKILLPVLKLASLGQLDLGGIASRGAGWPCWQSFRFHLYQYGSNTALHSFHSLDEIENWVAMENYNESK